MNNLNDLNFITSWNICKAFIFSQIFILISETNKTYQGSRNAPGAHFGSRATSPLVHLRSPDHRTLSSSPTGKAPGEAPLPYKSGCSLPLKVGHQQECLISALAPSTALTLHYLSDSLVLPLSSYSSIKHSFIPYWLSSEKLNSRTPLISPKGSEGRPCHLRSKYEYFPNEEEFILIFPTFCIFQGARQTSQNQTASSLVQSDGALQRNAVGDPYAFSLCTKDYDHRHLKFQGA